MEITYDFGIKAGNVFLDETANINRIMKNDLQQKYNWLNLRYHWLGRKSHAVFINPNENRPVALRQSLN